jgi:hypothetical protein
MQQMPVRRPGFIWSAPECLETRGLLSSAAFLLADNFNLAVGIATVAEIGSSSSTHAGNRISAGDGAVDEAARTPHVVGEPAAESTEARTAGGGGGAPRRANLQAMTVRVLLEPLLSVSRRTDSAADDETTGIESDSSDVAGEAAYEPAVTNSVVGWAPGAASVWMPMGYSADRTAGLEGRTNAGRSSTEADAVSSGSFGDVVNDPQSWRGDRSTGRGHLGDELRELAIVAVIADPAAASPAWAELLDGALNPDWEVIDQEMRRFLSGIGTLTDRPGEWGVGEAWLLWIGAAAALCLAHGASQGPRRFFRRAGRRRVGATAPDLVRVGPWPLGPP